MRYWLPFAFVLLFLAAVGVPSAVLAVPVGTDTSLPRSPAQIAHDRGVAALSKGALDEAKAAFEKSLTLDPDRAEALLGLADVARRRQDSRLATVHLRRALEQAPDNVEVHIAWSRFQFSRGRYDAAKVSLEKAIGLDPTAVVPRVELGVLYARGFGQHDKAIEAYREALRLDPIHAGAHFALGTALADLGDFDAAQKALEEAARLAPDNALAFAGLGRLQIARGNIDQAVSAYTKALKVQPRFVPAHLALGDIYLRRGETEKAIETYEGALLIEPSNVTALMRSGMIYQGQKRISEAERAYLAVIAVDSKQAVAYNNLSALMVEQGRRLDKAFEWAKIAVDLAPRVAQFRDTLAWVHRARGDLGEAVSTLESASEMDPRDAGILYHLGIAYEELGRREDALSAFDRALKVNPKLAVAQKRRERLRGSR